MLRGVASSSVAEASSSTEGVSKCLQAYKTADESVTNSATLQSDDHLIITLAANTTYLIRAVLFTSNGGATEGFKVALGGTTSVASMKAQIMLFNDATNALSGFDRVTALGTAVGAGLGSGSNFATIDGAVETGATGGTLIVRWAQNTAGAGSTLLQRGSTLMATKVG